MEVNFAPALQAKLNELAATSGRHADELVQDVMAEYVDELAEMRSMLDSRYDDIQSSKVQLIDGEEARALLKAKTAAGTYNRANLPVAACE